MPDSLQIKQHGHWAECFCCGTRAQKRWPIRVSKGHNYNTFRVCWSCIEAHGGRRLLADFLLRAYYAPVFGISHAYEKALVKTREMVPKADFEIHAVASSRRLVPDVPIARQPGDQKEASA